MTFEDDLKRADKYEQGLMQYAEYIEDVKEIKDVRDIKKFQDKDIDFIILYKDGGFKLIEIKVDFFTTENFILETISNVSYNTKGCILKSMSHEIWYFFPRLDKLYILNTKKLKDWIYKYKGKLTRCGDNAKGILIRRPEIWNDVKYKVKRIHLK